MQFLEHDFGFDLTQRFVFRQRGNQLVEEFVDGRELYVSIIGNQDQLEILPITELVFDKDKNPPEERIATRAAKWHEGYRERRGIRNQFARPISAQARETIEHVCRTAFRVLGLCDYARCDVRLAPDGQVWFLEANANPYIAHGHDFAEAAEKSGLVYSALIQRLGENRTGFEAYILSHGITKSTEPAPKSTGF